MMKTSMIAIDTNVLVYAVNADAPQNGHCHRLLQAVRKGLLRAVVFPQILLEFYAVVTNPRRFSQPLNPEQAWEQVEEFGEMLDLLECPPAILRNLGGLLRLTPRVAGNVFDAAIAVQMQAYGIHVICTYNTDDFSGLAGIVPRTPEQLLEPLPASEFEDHPEH